MAVHQHAPTHLLGHIENVTGRDLLAEGQPAWPLERPPLFLESSQPGLFVAGDVRHGSIKRVASAVGP